MGINISKWCADWQNEDHASHFDVRTALDDSNLLRNYECFNDVLLLNERIDRSKSLTLLEVGCATGEFYRYLQVRYPKLKYYGIDISHPAITRAKEKYPEARFFVSDPEAKILNVFEDPGIPRHPEVVYTKDVVHHQTSPFEFVSELLQIASEALIMRVRTRDIGPTETNPEFSCQYHYKGWVPYIVMNLQDLLDRITDQVPGCEVVVYRNHVVLGGQYNRHLPEACSLKRTGTAETAIGVFLATAHPGKITVEDRRDNPRYNTFKKWLRSAAHCFR